MEIVLQYLLLVINLIPAISGDGRSLPYNVIYSSINYWKNFPENFCLLLTTMIYRNYRGINFSMNKISMYDLWE